MKDQSDPPGTAKLACRLKTAERAQVLWTYDPLIDIRAMEGCHFVSLEGCWLLCVFDVASQRKWDASGY